MSDPWFPEHDEIIRKMWAAGMSSKEIGERLGRSKNSIIGRAHRMKVKPRPSPLLVKKPEDDARILAMRASGARNGEIARALGRTSAAISHRLRKLGKGPPPQRRDPRPPSVFEFRARSEMAALRSRPAKRAPVVIPYVSRSATCLFPLWGDFERPTHEYCGKPVWYRSYCRDCAGIAYGTMRAVAA